MSEPWRIVEHNWSDTSIYCGDKQIVLLSIDDPAQEDEMGANARRIVACVNACRGIPMEELESLAPDALALVMDEWRHERRDGL